MGVVIVVSCTQTYLENNRNYTKIFAAVARDNNHDTHCIEKPKILYNIIQVLCFSPPKTPAQ